MLQSVLISVVFALGGARAKAIVPELTGPYKVGTTVLELIDASRQDPFAPTPQPRDLIISLFYPTQTRNCTLAPQFPPITAAAIDSRINGTGVAESVFTRACDGSPLSRPDLPLLFFGPGLGTSRLFHSDTAAEFASRGWNVVTIDHPYDGMIVEYPDGRFVLPTDSPTQADTTPAQYLDARVKDLSFVLDSLSDPAVTSRIPGLDGRHSRGMARGKLRTDKVGVFGHSLGGATALQLLAEDARFAAGADLDGAVFGPVVQAGTDAPFVYVRRPGHTHESDPTWAEAWPNLTGFKREYIVDGTTHGSFTDLPILRDLLGAETLGEYADEVGTIEGARIVEIETALLGALFDRYIKGHGGELLDGQGLDAYPEITLATN